MSYIVQGTGFLRYHLRLPLVTSSLRHPRHLFHHLPRVPFRGWVGPSTPGSPTSPFLRIFPVDATYDFLPRLTSHSLCPQDSSQVSHSTCTLRDPRYWDSSHTVQSVGPFLRTPSPGSHLGPTRDNLSCRVWDTVVSLPFLRCRPVGRRHSVS